MPPMIDPEAAASSAAAVDEVLTHMRSSGWRLILVDSPPGAGKSTLVVTVADVRTREHGDQVPIITQTNDQADDLVRSLAARLAGTGRTVGRLHASRSGYRPPDDLQADPGIRCSSDVGALADCAVLVAPIKKWAFVTAHAHWSYAIIDEAYQVSSHELMSVGAKFDAFVAVGDPGQLSPWSSGDETLVRGIDASPLDCAANTLYTTVGDATRLVTLPVSWRLTPAAVDVVSPAFYRQQFSAGTLPGARRLRFSRLGANDSIDAALGQASTSGWALLELPEAHMPHHDPGAVAAITSLVTRALNAHGRCTDEQRGIHPLEPHRIAVGVVHRAQRNEVQTLLTRALAPLGVPAGTVVVDTANRLQGREYDLVIAWHPLSGRRAAGTFHIDAGRLCVLLSRHRQACVVVTRGGLREQLSTYPQPDKLWLGERHNIDGWEANLTVLEKLAPHRIAA
ncbi:AAA family ATPase [Arthrobacter sp. GCM10027362]|uniref:AAA family ATPase n=1 Tax=Arthrobacter sp. GCM10027362 TaxID=3273379 RepID=UPI00363DAA91